jgi:hypothetical protein
MSDTKHEDLMKIGKSAYESIVEMVSALECDYDRLEELKTEHDELKEEAGEPDDEDRGTAPEAYGDWLDEYGEELEELKKDAGECKDREEAEQRIQEDALSVRIFGERTNGEWEADKFEILLTTGGPAVRIMGELDGEDPKHAWLEVQDWGTPWTEYYESNIRDTLLTYCRCFYFGE